ncbi:type II toxin-antitoxin system HicB family antitoxin [Ectothiorhodospiraceae bacterium BW-2]|nr:type II toxin-antitoxin system HicB family antitoxin [Ectothiorhodospiraceae bacterium BW-2]
MEHIVNIHIEALDDGVGYLATSDEIQGLVAQGQTVEETLTIARDVVKQLLQARTERNSQLPLRKISSSFDYPLLIGG